MIRIYDKEGTILAELSGHSSGITSLEHGPEHTLLSGSWDGSCRVAPTTLLKCSVGLWTICRKWNAREVWRTR